MPQTLAPRSSPRTHLCTATQQIAAVPYSPAPYAIDLFCFLPCVRSASDCSSASRGGGQGDLYCFFGCFSIVSAVPYQLPANFAAHFNSDSILCAANSDYDEYL